MFVALLVTGKPAQKNTGGAQFSDQPKTIPQGSNRLARQTIEQVQGQSIKADAAGVAHHVRNQFRGITPAKPLLGLGIKLPELYANVFVAQAADEFHLRQGGSVGIDLEDGLGAVIN